MLILGPDMPVEDALRLATVFDVQLPELSVILVGEPDPAFVLLAMRAGIRDILSPSRTRPRSDAAGTRLPVLRQPEPDLAVQQPGGPKGLVIGVFSPKGGVGKTTIATNIAIGLGQIAPMGVVIVDLDLQFGDVASGLYLNPEHTVTDAVSSAASQDSLVLKAFLTVHSGNIYALCAPHRPVEADYITPEQVTRMSNNSRNNSSTSSSTPPGITYFRQSRGCVHDDVLELFRELSNIRVTCSGVTKSASTGLCGAQSA